MLDFITSIILSLFQDKPYLILLFAIIVLIIVYIKNKLNKRLSLKYLYMERINSALLFHRNIVCNSIYIVPASLILAWHTLSLPIKNNAVNVSNVFIIIIYGIPLWLFAIVLQYKNISFKYSFFEKIIIIIPGFLYFILSNFVMYYFLSQKAVAFYISLLMLFTFPYIIMILLYQLIEEKENVLIIIKTQEKTYKVLEKDYKPLKEHVTLRIRDKNNHIVQTIQINNSNIVETVRQSKYLKTKDKISSNP